MASSHPDPMTMEQPQLEPMDSSMTTTTKMTLEQDENTNKTTTHEEEEKQEKENETTATSEPNETTERTNEESNKEQEKIKAAVAAAKKKAIYEMLWNELKLEMGNVTIGCICLIGSTASNAGTYSFEGTTIPSFCNIKTKNVCLFR